MSGGVWILILFLKSGYAGGVISQEFNSYDACVVAVEDVKKFGVERIAICVEK